MGLHVEIDLPTVENHPALLRFFERFAAAATREAQSLSASRIKGGSGMYERSFKAELIPGAPPKLLFGNSSPIAIYVEEDTRPHKITVKPPGRASFTNSDRPGALRWYQGAKQGSGPANLRFAPEVHHPGTKGMHIVRDAVSAAARRLSA